MAHKMYRPYSVSHNERLAFRLKDDKPSIQFLTAKRRFRNSCLKEHEQVLRYSTIKPQITSAVQYEGERRIVVGVQL